MLAPVDPRPYAGPTDLVTAADVARWLEEMGPMMGSIAPPGVRLFAGVAAEAPAGLLAHELRARLDRERRQACRRGALDAWRGAMVCLGDAGVARARRHPRRKLGTLPLVACASVPGSLRPWQAAFVLLARALAFRAAARAP